MALGIYTDQAGTAYTGTALPLPVIGSTVTLYLKAAPGQRSAVSVTIPASTDCEVSVDGGAYGSSQVIDENGVTDAYLPVAWKRTAHTTNSADVGIATVPHLWDVATEAIPDTTTPILSGTLIATPGDQQVTLAGPTATDDAGVAKWQYQQDSGAWTDIADSALGTMPSIIVTGLIDGTQYAYAVRALDAAGNASNVSNTANATPVDTTAPTLTGTLTATPGSEQAVLDWPDATDNVGVDGYDVEYGTTDAYGSSVSPDPTASNCTVTGLTNSTLYYFRVRAHDAAGNVSGWLTATTTPAAEVFHDDFNRTDAATLGTDWTNLTGYFSDPATLTGNWKVVGNNARSATDGVDALTSTAHPAALGAMADARISVTMAAPSTATAWLTYLQVFGRYSASTHGDRSTAATTRTITSGDIAAATDSWNVSSGIPAAAPFAALFDNGERVRVNTAVTNATIWADIVRGYRGGSAATSHANGSTLTTYITPLDASCFILLVSCQGTVYLQKKVGTGGPATVGDASGVAWTTGDVLALEMHGDSIKVLKNGTAIINYTDSATEGGAKVSAAGTCCLQGAGDATQYMQVTDFRVEAV